MSLISKEHKRVIRDDEMFMDRKRKLYAVLKSFTPRRLERIVEPVRIMRRVGRRLIRQKKRKNVIVVMI
ncbi:hypothetical protein CHS0354_010904 [Potamilus streckersoni]|uniref:Uncharacterized protein n=1 Tax=Potamilus streckersoni TaxID=2493646 RepID=A0AAE0VW41_9BIVA|nr:hypothetical protein CHS0354_010904 [Potamilus streckersoni]